MPMWDRKRQVMRHYDRTAKFYDTQYHEEQEAKIRAAIDNLTLNEDNIILDAGCGTGLLFAHIIDKSRFIVGTDISREVLREAMKKAKSYKKVALVLADADNMPFHNRPFNVVFAITLLQNTPSPRATLNEIKRLSKSNATIVVTGLRKAFAEEEFSKMLKQADLRITVRKLDKQMREYVCVCIKMRR